MNSICFTIIWLHSTKDLKKRENFVWIQIFGFVTQPSKYQVKPTEDDVSQKWEKNLDRSDTETSLSTVNLDSIAITLSFQTALNYISIMTSSLSSRMLGSWILLSLIAYLQSSQVSAFSSASNQPIASPSTTDDSSDSLVSRRSMLVQTFTTASGAAAVVLSSEACHASAGPPKSNIDPETAYLNLRKAREELVFAGKTYFPKQDWDGLREYLNNEDAFINNYDENANALLTSKRLDTESKQAIGTIRRYGVGADVIIMYGGLKAELAEDNERPNSAELSKYYVKTLDSLEEVISIVRSNKGFSKLE